jgi:hypothetical protein
MRKMVSSALFLWLAVAPLHGVRKPHVVSFGKWQTVKWFADTPAPKISEPKDQADAAPKGIEEKGVDLKIRPLYVDTQLKENTTGPPHEITDRVFVVRRAYRVNDSLPGEEATKPRWRWQLGGWLLVDRVSGRVSALNLPEFDAHYSSASWYRDYVGYCGVSDDGKKLHAVVAILGRRKPVVKAAMGEADEQNRDANCAPPTWERQPTQITFDLNGGASKATFSVRGHSADLVPDEPEEEISSK